MIDRPTTPIAAARGRARRAPWHVAASAALVGLGWAAGCNLVTGADGIDIGADSGGGSTTGAGGGGLAPAGGGGSTSTGTGGTSTGTSSTTSGTGAVGGSSPTGGSGGTPPPPDCSTPCGDHRYCDIPTDTCHCDPGFEGENCTPVAPGDPASRSEAEVCQRWSDAHQVSTPDALASNGNDCDAGYLRQGALDDTLARLNMFRWLVGLGPAGDSLDGNRSAQQCAVLEAWFTWPNGVSPHSPTESSSQCWTPSGASAAGASNLAWGSGHPAQAIDQFIVDSGNLDTMGHRRWIFNPPLDPVSIGYWSGGGPYGDGMCLGVFGGGGSGPFPAWTALPNPGYTPIEVTTWPWTFQGNDGAIADASVSVVRVDDSTPLAVTVHYLQQGYGPTAIAWTPVGWSAEAGRTYRVTLSNLSGADVVYDVKPVACS